MKAFTGMSGLSGLVTFSPSDVPQAEADALIWLFHATSGPSWTNNTGWLIDPVVNNWFGVTVAGGRVTEIDLSANGATVNGDIAAFPWSHLQSLTTLYLYNTSVSGDISGWTLPAGLTNLRLYNTSLSGDISGWVVPGGLYYLFLHSTSLSGAPDFSVSTDLRSYWNKDSGCSQVDVDAVLLGVYNRRAAFIFATPNLKVGGTNAAPTGFYQANCPVAATGKEMAFHLVNDPCAEGHRKWTVTFTA